MHCELNTTGLQEPLRAQHPFCCSCPQPAEFTGVLFYMVYLLPEQGFLWVLFYLFLLLFLGFAGGFCPSFEAGCKSASLGRARKSCGGW